ncbi:MAG: transcriptional regulator [Proteobacteria bacterium CG1_02_64_396]|nr:MAG: transcriptional regulator [Proteobacteria bacterium CG1_02_64_396]
MRFSVLICIAPQERETAVIETCRQAGAGGVTILEGKGMGLQEKKTFLGLTFEAMESFLVFVLERSLATHVLKAIKKGHQDHTIAFIIPIEHLTGIDLNQVDRFVDQVKEEI